MRLEDFKTITEKHVETCKLLAENEGSCERIYCIDCPFDHANASNCENCVTIGLEVKTATGRQSKEQKEIEQQFKKNGAEYYIVRSLEDVKEVINGK